MRLFTITHRHRITLLILALLLVCALLLPALAGAQATASGSAAAGTQVNVGTLAGTQQSPSCKIISFTGFDPSCIWISAMSWLGSWFLTMGGALLRLAGALFDSLILKVIVDFKNTLDALGITQAINDGWTVFRDFSNILIIGIFVFIAISIILGLKEFGQKKLIANVLIVAVLINFSLLFTKIIIDVSNFTAFQIYTQVASVSGSVNDPNKDIAQAFLSPMGITNIWDTQTITDAVGQQNAGQSSALSRGLQAFAFGLVGGILLLAVAAVLLYGCFLIAARAILFIFLMLTAALAFATYLVPSLAKGEYGWSTWWKSLINNAVFAPLLMLFLAVSLGIVNQAGAHRLIDCSGTCTSDLGAIIANPTTQLQTASGWSAILIYIIGIGLLFISFRMASKFAGTISGFNLAAALPAFGLGMAARLAGLAGTAALGVPGRYVGGRLAAAGKDAAGRGQSWRASMFDLAAQTAKQTTKTDFNLANTALGKQMANVAGLKGVIAGQSAGKGLEGITKAMKERSAEKADRLTHTPEEVEKLRAAELKKATQSLSGDIARVTGTSAGAASQQALQESVKAMRSERETMAKTLDQDMKQLQSERTALRNAVATSNSPQDSNRLKEVDKQIVSLAERKTKIDEQDNKIKEAEELSRKIVERASAALPKSIPLEGNAKNISRALKEDIAVSTAHRRITNLPFRLAGVNTEETDQIAQSMRKALKDREESKQLKKIAAEVSKMSETTKEHHEYEKKHDERIERKADRISTASNQQSSGHEPQHH